MHSVVFFTLSSPFNSFALDLETPFALLAAAPCSLPEVPAIITNKVITLEQHHYDSSPSDVENPLHEGRGNWSFSVFRTVLNFSDTIVLLS